MADFFLDQAEGLRRLLDHESLRVVTLLAGSHGVGKTSVVINLAAALARFGRRVLVIDENHGPANVCGLLGVRSRFALGHVMRQSCRIEDAVLEGPRGISVLPAASSAHALRSMRMMEEESLIESFGRLDGRYDVVLIDTPCAGTGAPGLFSRAVQDTLIVSSTAPEAIKSSYALIKNLRGAGHARRYYLLLNRVACQDNAKVVADNLSGASMGYLATPLTCLAPVPKDHALAHAARAFQPVVDATPAAPSARAFRTIADTISRWPRSDARPQKFDGLMQRMLSSSRFVFSNAGA